MFRSNAALTVAILLGACSDPPTAATASSQTLDVTLDQLAAESNGRGDADAAAAFSAGSLALRLGVQPTDIAVTVDGETSRYLAIVTGVASTTRAGTEVIHRSLVAWQGDRRPVALLQVSAMGDHGVFGAGSGDRAAGVWANLARGHRWLATDGSAALTLGATGETCDGARTAGMRCVMARYHVAIDGLFRQAATRNAPAGEAVRISVSESSVAGILVER